MHPDDLPTFTKLYTGKVTHKQVRHVKWHACLQSQPFFIVLVTPHCIMAHAANRQYKMESILCPAGCADLARHAETAAGHLPCCRLSYWTNPFQTSGSVLR